MKLSHMIMHTHAYTRGLATELVTVTTHNTKTKATVIYLYFLYYTMSTTVYKRCVHLYTASVDTVNTINK